MFKLKIRNLSCFYRQKSIPLQRDFKIQNPKHGASKNSNRK